MHVFLSIRTQHDDAAHCLYKGLAPFYAMELMTLMTCEEDGATWRFCGLGIAYERERGLGESQLGV